MQVQGDLVPSLNPWPWPQYYAALYSCIAVSGGQWVSQDLREDLSECLKWVAMFCSCHLCFAKAQDKKCQKGKGGGRKRGDRDTHSVSSQYCRAVLRQGQRTRYTRHTALRGHHTTPNCPQLSYKPFSGDRYRGKRATNTLGRALG